VGIRAFPHPLSAKHKARASPRPVSANAAAWMITVMTHGHASCARRCVQNRMSSCVGQARFRDIFEPVPSILCSVPKCGRWRNLASRSVSKPILHSTSRTTRRPCTTPYAIAQLSLPLAVRNRGWCPLPRAAHCVGVSSTMDALRNGLLIPTRIG